MVAFNVSADDASPLIVYSPAGAWTDSPTNDSSAPSYSQRSWHVSSSYGASATFHFNGTGIWFFGAKRPRYGSYSISIDGQSVHGNARSPKPTFQQFLGGHSGLSNGPHTAVFTNTGSGSYIDLDSIIFETQIDHHAAITKTTMDDTSPAITYLPTPEDWIVAKMPNCFNDTLHFTRTGGAQAQFAFHGDAVAIYGTASPYLTEYTVKMDGVMQSFQSSSTGLASDIHMNTLLYFTGSLTSGQHHLTLTANPAQSGLFYANALMGIDRIVVLNTSNDTTTKNNHGNVIQPSLVGVSQNLTGPTSALGGLGTSPLTGVNLADNVSQGNTQGHTSKRRNVAVIGGVVGIIVLLLLTILAILLFRRRRRQERSLFRIILIRQPKTPVLPMQPPPKPCISLPNPFSDSSYLEKVAPYSIPLGRNENPFTDDARVKLPETCVTRDAYDGRSSDLQVQSRAPPTASTRLTRPPTLMLPLRG